MNDIERTLDLFSNGYSCAQSIAVAFGRHFGIDENAAKKFSRSFGMGMSTAQTCGAVTGALMIIGMNVKESGDEKADRYKAYDESRRFMKEFEEKHKTLICRELLDGLDISTSEGRTKAREKNVFKTICPRFVQTAAEILEKSLI